MKKGVVDDSVITEIRSRIDIVQLVGEYVRLIPSGRNLKGLCPFHQEKTPSFNVVPEKQMFYCFGCHKGGDSFRFLMDIEHFSFPETIRALAQRCGVSYSAEKDQVSEEKKVMYSLLEEVSGFFQSCLSDRAKGKHGREYLVKRGISPQAAKKFQIGFAPDSWDDLFKGIGKTANKIELLERNGLIKPKKTGEGFYDSFRNRVIFPIFDPHGRVAGFGGRVIDPADEPKYLNSPETELFNKRKLLFNLKNALPQVRKNNEVIVVEGYLDVVSLVQAGVDNVVATLGTAITQEQIYLLSRNCDSVFFCYDADQAGQKATIRAISLKRETPLSARIITFENPKDDPDSFIQREGREKFLARMRNAKDIYSFLFDARTRDLKKPLDIHDKERLMAEFKGFVQEIQSPIARSEIIHRLSRLIDTDVKALESTLFPGIPSKESGGIPMKPLLKIDGQKQREEWVIKHLFDHPEEIDKVKNFLGSADFSDPLLRELFEILLNSESSMGRALKSSEVITKIDDPKMVSRLSELIISLDEVPEYPFMECAIGMVEQNLKIEAERLEKRIRIAQQKESLEEIDRLILEQYQLRRRMSFLNRNN
ncbi:DNA primase [bacterium]|nr:DNA primase [bacterium]